MAELREKIQESRQKSMVWPHEENGGKGVCQMGCGGNQEQGRGDDRGSGEGIVYGMMVEWWISG